MEIVKIIIIIKKNPNTTGTILYKLNLTGNLANKLYDLSKVKL